MNKHDFDEVGAAEPYEEDECCVVEETDPDEQHYPKHEPAQLSSLHKNKTSNFSQNTGNGESTKQHKSPKHHQAPQDEKSYQQQQPTEGLLKDAFLREQQQQQKRIQQ